MIAREVNTDQEYADSAQHKGRKLQGRLLHFFQLDRRETEARVEKA